MASKRIIVLVALAVVVGLMGTAAYTFASVERGVTINITEDEAGTLALDPNPNVDGAHFDSDGDHMIVDPENGGYGLNPNATVRYGDNETATTAQEWPMFNITNNDDDSKVVNVTYQDTANSLAGTDYTVAFEVYHSGAKVGTAKLSGTGTSNTVTVTGVAQGDDINVIMWVETPGESSDITKTGDILDGELQINSTDETRTVTNP